MGKSITVTRHKKSSDKAKKTGSSIKKDSKKVDLKSELDELKQLLYLEKPKINLDLFDSMNIGGDS